MVRASFGNPAVKQLLGFATVPLGSIAVAGSLAASKALPFVMEHQMQDQWCWAATSFSVNRFFNSGTPWSQCKIVNGELGLTTCCNDGSSASCNRWWYLEKALTRVGNLNVFSSGKPAFTALKAEIDGNKPMCLRIGWTGGGGHVVAVSAYDDNGGSQIVTIDDPWLGRSTGVSFNSFPTSYNGGGTWTHTYTTH